MAYSNSSFFAGIGAAFAAIAVGFAGGAMITTSAVQPPNRLERVSAGVIVPPNASATPSSPASTAADQTNAAKPAPRDPPPSPVVAAAPSAPVSDPQPASQPVSPTAAKTDAASSVQEHAAPAAAKNSAPAPIAKSDDAAPAKSERTTVGRAPDPSRDVSRSSDSNRDRKRADDRRPTDDRRFSDRKRRQDQDERRLDEATNVVRQMPRGNAADEIVERDDTPRFRTRPRHSGLYGDDDAPRAVSEPPPRFGLF